MLIRRALFGAVLVFASSAAAATPDGAPQASSLFTFVKSVQVTPAGNYGNADFVRIGYVPGRDRFIVTFGTQLSQQEGGCSTVLCPPSGCFYPAYAYKEYTTDMVETGKAGIVSCHATSDTGGFFRGDDFYLASAEIHDNVEGWNLAKFNAVTWASSVDFWYPLTDSQMRGGDPTVAFVNGQMDVSSVYESLQGTHHNFFTTDLQFVSQRILSDTQHQGFSSLINQGGITHFLTSKAGVSWSVIVMQYDPSWTYLGVKTLRDHAATPQGLAFDGTRYYVAYTDRTDGIPFCENVHLAAFDTSWNLVEDIALTSHTLQDQTSSIHPWVALKDNRLYVSYSENSPAGGIETLQAYVKVYDLSTVSTCTSFAISPTSATATASAGSQSVTVTGSPSGCTGGSWTASTGTSWLTVSPSSGTGSSSVTTSWTANTSTSARSGTATIAGNSFAVTQSGSGGGACAPNATTLCIANRFQVQVAWSTSQGGGQSGQGHAVSTSSIGFSLGGIFWFFDSTNPEMLVKVLNGCSSNGRYWFFASAGTNVGLNITVTDTQSGQSKTYTNPDLTAAQPIQDTNAFASCP